MRTWRLMQSKYYPLRTQTMLATSFFGVLVGLGMWLTMVPAKANEPTPSSSILETIVPPPTALPTETPEVTQKEQKKSTSEQCGVSTLYPDSIRQWCDLITKQSKKRGLDPDLVAALVWQESGGNPQAYSKSGAVGLMQVMPRDGLAASFMCINGPCFANRPTMEELFKPTFNVKYGTEFLGNLVAQNGLREGLRRYGPANVGYYYADKVLGIYNRYKQ